MRNSGHLAALLTILGQFLSLDGYLFLIALGRPHCCGAWLKVLARGLKRRLSIRVALGVRPQFVHRRLVLNDALKPLD